MPRNLEHLELDAEMGQGDPFAVTDPMGDLPDTLVMRPEHRHAVVLQQLRVAPDVVGMMVV